MTTPGSNTFAQALSIQGKQPVNYYAASSRSVNTIGLYEPLFNAPILISQAAVQPVQRNLYDQLGLDLQKRYVTLYLSKAAKDIARGTQGDRFSYSGRMYQLESNLDWFVQDQWVGVICADIGPDTNLYLSAGYFSDPGATDVSFLLFSNIDFSNGRLVIIDIPKWTYADGGYNGILYSGNITEGLAITTNALMSGQDQGSLETLFGENVDDYSESSDAPPDPFPGLSTFGVVAGDDLRVQHNVRLTISSAANNQVDILLKRGAAIP